MNETLGCERDRNPRLLAPQTLPLVKRFTEGHLDAEKERASLNS